MERKKDIQWETLEYHHKEKRPDWYWSVGIIGISLMATSILLKNLLFALVVLLSTFTIMLYGHRKPKKITCHLNSKGVSMDGTFYSYSGLDSFWVEDRYGDPKIIFKSKHMLSPFVIMPIEGVSSENIQEYLLDHLYEEEHHEPISHKIMEMLGF